MYQRDFILRMIEMLAELVAGILGMIKKGKFEEASESLDNAYMNLLKEDAGFFRDLPLENISEKLINEHNYTNGHLEILLELFYAEAELHYAKGNLNESLPFYKKSKLLLEYVLNESGTFSFEKQSRLSKLHDRISEIERAY